MDVPDVKGPQSVWGHYARCHNTAQYSGRVGGKQLVIRDIMKSRMRAVFSMLPVCFLFALFECVYLISRSKNICWRSLQPSAFNGVFWVNSLQCCVLWGFCCGLSACFRLGEGADTKYCCPVVDSQTTGALTVASLFVFCHVMLHVFGTFYCFFNHLAQSSLSNDWPRSHGWKLYMGFISKGLQSFFGILCKEGWSVDQCVAHNGKVDSHCKLTASTRTD